MPLGKQRGARIIYVAGSARELPDDVQEWLSRPEHPAVAAAGVYEALAMLSARRRPTALLVSMESVDWDELDFFEYAARISRSTPIYVIGGEHLRAKTEAALTRGARLFDAEALEGDLRQAMSASRHVTTRDLLAGALEAVHAESPAALRVAAGVRSTGTGDSTVVAGRSARGVWLGRPVPERPTAAPDDQDEEADAPALAADSVLSGEDDREEEDRPVVRLVSRGEADEEAASGEQASSPIPFPWAPSANRPKRIPPSARVEPSKEPDGAQAAGRGLVSGRAEAGSAGSRPVPPVELTPEELAALVGKPLPPTGVQGEPRA